MGCLLVFVLLPGKLNGTLALGRLIFCYENDGHRQRVAAGMAMGEWIRFAQSKLTPLIAKHTSCAMKHQLRNFDIHTVLFRFSMEGGG